MVKKAKTETNKWTLDDLASDMWFEISQYLTPKELFDLRLVSRTNYYGIRYNRPLWDYVANQNLSLEDYLAVLMQLLIAYTPDSQLRNRLYSTFFAIPNRKHSKKQMDNFNSKMSKRNQIARKMEGIGLIKDYLNNGRITLLTHEEAKSNDSQEVLTKRLKALMQTFQLTQYNYVPVELSLTPYMANYLYQKRDRPDITSDPYITLETCFEVIKKPETFNTALLYFLRYIYYFAPRLRLSKPNIESHISKYALVYTILPNRVFPIKFLDIFVDDSTDVTYSKSVKILDCFSKTDQIKGKKDLRTIQLESLIIRGNIRGEEIFTKIICLLENNKASLRRIKLVGADFITPKTYDGLQFDLPIHYEDLLNKIKDCKQLKELTLYLSLDELTMLTKYTMTDFYCRLGKDLSEISNRLDKLNLFFTGNELWSISEDCLKTWTNSRIKINAKYFYSNCEEIPSKDIIGQRVQIIDLRATKVSFTKKVDYDDFELEEYVNNLKQLQQFAMAFGRFVIVKEDCLKNLKKRGIAVSNLRPPEELPQIFKRLRI